MLTGRAPAAGDAVPAAEAVEGTEKAPADGGKRDAKEEADPMATCPLFPPADGDDCAT